MLKKSGRQSNIEVLRILSMFLVMLVHYLPLRSPTTIEVVINAPMKAFLNLELGSISIICVHCFILISGYFGIRWSAKSFLSLIFQLLYWAFIGYFLAQYFMEPFVPSGYTYSFKSFLSQMLGWYQGRWFVSAYIVLYIFSPIINDFIKDSSEKSLLRYLIVFYVFSTIYGWVIGSQEFNAGLSAISLMGLYLIGAWLRKSERKCVTWSLWYDLVGYIACTFILTLGSAGLLLLGVGSSIYGYLNPLVIIESIFLFQFFRKINLGSIKWVNFLAASAFSAFLLHCHPYFGVQCSKMWRSLHQYDYALIYVLASITILFVVAVLIDKIRVVIWNVILAPIIFGDGSIMKKL